MLPKLKCALGNFPKLSVAHIQAQLPSLYDVKVV